MTNYKIPEFKLYFLMERLNCQLQTKCLRLQLLNDHTVVIYAMVCLCPRKAGVLESVLSVHQYK